MGLAGSECRACEQGQFPQPPQHPVGTGDLGGLHGGQDATERAATIPICLPIETYPTV